MNIHERLTEMNSTGSPKNMPSSPGSVFKSLHTSPLVQITRKDKVGEPKSIMDFIRRQATNTAGRKDGKQQQLVGRNSKIRVSNGAVT